VFNNQSVTNITINHNVNNTRLNIGCREGNTNSYPEALLNDTYIYNRGLNLNEIKAICKQYNPSSVPTAPSNLRN
jgi:hypothetical protein